MPHRPVLAGDVPSSSRVASERVKSGLSALEAIVQALGGGRAAMIDSRRGIRLGSASRVRTRPRFPQERESKAQQKAMKKICLGIICAS
jgi:hypothetical protein